jgi:hypothetical protein
VALHLRAMNTLLRGQSEGLDGDRALERRRDDGLGRNARDSVDGRPAPTEAAVTRRMENVDHLREQIAQKLEMIRSASGR